MKFEHEVVHGPLSVVRNHGRRTIEYRRDEYNRIIVDLLACDAIGAHTFDRGKRRASNSFVIGGNLVGDLQLRHDFDLIWACHPQDA